MAFARSQFGRQRDFDARHLRADRVGAERSAAQLGLDAGADVAFVQDRLDHANIQNTMVYMRYTTVTRDAQTRQRFASHRVV